MPKFGWPSASPLLWIVTMVIAMDVFAYFRQPGWIGDFTGSGDDAADE